MTKNRLYKLLTNVTYCGQIRYKDEIHQGEHAGIVSPEVWQQVQTTLERRGRGGTSSGKNRFGAILKGRLRCVCCQSAMTPTHSTRAGKRYRYYVCSHAQKCGWDTCPAPSLPAHEIEKFVIDQIRSLGQDAGMIELVLEQAEQQVQTQRRTLNDELRSLDRDLIRWHADVRDLVAQNGRRGDEALDVDRLSQLQDRIQKAEQRGRALQEELSLLSATGITRDEVSAALRRFDPVRDTLTSREQTRVVELLVSQVDYDGKRGKVSVTFHPHGFQQLGAELTPTEDRA